MFETPLQIERDIKLLGVISNPHFTFHIHARVLNEQAAECLKIVKAPAGTDWDQKKTNEHYDLQSSQMVENLLRCPNLVLETLKGRRPVASRHTKYCNANRN